MSKERKTIGRHHDPYKAQHHVPFPHWAPGGSHREDGAQVHHGQAQRRGDEETVRRIEVLDGQGMEAAAAKRVTKLKKEYESLKTALKELDREQTKAEKRMKALSPRSKALPEAIRTVKKLNTAWIKGAERKAAVKEELIKEYRAVLDYKKRTKK